MDAEALARAGFRTSDGRGGAGGGNDEEAAARRAQMEEQRNSMLKQILTPEAKDRLSRVQMVKPENARAVEEHLIRLARAGKLSDRVDESTLIKMLEDVSAQVESGAAGDGKIKKVIIQRKKRKGSDEEDDDDF